MGFFDLPTNWIFIEYEDGERKNVANCDVLDRKMAEKYKANWEKPNRKVVKVTLETPHKNVIKTFTF